MSDVMLEIEMMIEDGVHPMTIARMLGIPIVWVYDTLEQMEPNEEDMSPFATMNS
jgi:hypothetical protein